MKYYKNLNNEFDLINFFKNLEDKRYYFCKNDVLYVLYKEKEKFILEFSKGIKVKGSEFRFQNIDNKIIDINILKIRVINSLIMSSNFYDNTKYEINSFCNNGFNKEGYLFYKLIIPYHENLNIRYSDYFSSDLMIYIPINNTNCNGIKCKIKDFTFQIYCLKNYFIVECIDKIDFLNFDNYSRNCLATFGFFTGFVPMNKGYFFGYDDPNKNFRQFLYQNNFIDNYTGDSLITLNAYEYYQHCDLNFDLNENGIKDDERIENIQKKLRSIKCKHFEKLLNEIICNENFAEIIYTYLNINNKNNKMSLNIKCASYSILLEMITNLIADKCKEKMYFIKDKVKRDELRKELINKASSFFKENKIDDFKNSPISKRLDNINAPTNQDKLIKPFEMLDIQLSDNEKKILNNRNDFLHGRNPVQDLNFSEQTKKLFYISLKLNYLVVVLILKYIEYSGIVKNLSKIYLDYLNLPELEEEDYYKEI